MSGTYAHESQNIENSKAIYAMSWQPVVNDPKASGELLATGYSCRSQVKRLDQQQHKHPIQALAELLTGGIKFSSDKPVFNLQLSLWC